ncbi:MAG TPA: septum formation family protein [Dehalococcoidia bacterium]|jgi:hypothetical protein
MILSASMRSASRIALLVGAVAILAACSGAERDDSGRIVDGGDLDVFTMQIGDCFQDVSNDLTEVANVSAVPCSQAHDNEVFYIFALTSDAFPGEDSVEQSASEGCLPAFETYVGAAYEESHLDYSWLTPTLRSWGEKDDREIVCILFDANFDRLTDSMKGKAE